MFIQLCHFDISVKGTLEKGQTDEDGKRETEMPRTFSSSRTKILHKSSSKIGKTGKQKFYSKKRRDYFLTNLYKKEENVLPPSSGEALQALGEQMSTMVEREKMVKIIDDKTKNILSCEEYQKKLLFLRWQFQEHVTSILESATIEELKTYLKKYEGFFSLMKIRETAPYRGMLCPSQTRH